MGSILKLAILAGVVVVGAQVLDSAQYQQPSYGEGPVSVAASRPSQSNYTSSGSASSHVSRPSSNYKDDGHSVNYAYKKFLEASNKGDRPNETYWYQQYVMAKQR